MNPRFITTRLSLLRAAALALACPALSSAATLTWDSGNTANGATIDPAAGTWDTTAGSIVWNNAGANAPWTQTSATAATNAAIFGGTDGTYDVSLGTALASQFVRFQNSGYTLSAGAVRVLRLSNSVSAAAVLAADSGKTGSIGANVTVQQAGTAFFGSTGVTAGGTVVIESGGIYEQTGSNTWAMDGTGSILRVKSGGIMRMTAAGGQFVIGATTASNPNLHVDGGSVLINGNNTNFIISSGTGAVNGSLTLDSGSVSMAATTARALSIGGQALNIGTVHLNGGTLGVRQIIKGHVDAIGTFNFNGGTLRAVSGASGSVFMDGLTTANVRDGGAVFDSNGFDLTVMQTLSHSAIGGDAAIDGGVVKNGAGRLTLGGTNTYTGPTTVNAGTLSPASESAFSSGAVVVSGGTLLLESSDLTGISGITVEPAGTLKVTGDHAVSAPLSASGTVDLRDSIATTLTVNGAVSLNGATLDFDLLGSGSDRIAASGAASSGGASTVNLNLVAGETLTSGNYTLMTANGGISAANFALGTRPTGFNTYSFASSTANSLVLSITVGGTKPATAYWTGAASRTGNPTDPTNQWGYGAALAPTKSNWSTNAAGTADALQVPGENSDVIFTASNATGSAGLLATQLEGAYQIKSLTFNVPAATGITSAQIDTNGSNLTIGTAGITLAAASNAGATISGSGSVILADGQTWTNHSTQPLVVSTPVSAVQNFSILTLEGTGNGGITLGPLSNGTGTLDLTASHPGVTTLQGNQSYTGPTALDEGKLLLDNAGSFSSPIQLNVAAADALTFNQSSQNLAVAHAITGTGGIVKNGPGSLTLGNGSNGYEAGTVINGGILLVNSSTGAGTGAGQNCTVGLMAPTNVVTINNGATLAINGTAALGNSLMLPEFAPSVVINAGGTLSGNSFVAFIPNLTLNGGTINVGNGNTTGGFNTNLGLVGTVVVSGSVPSLITTVGAGANASISLGAEAVPGASFQVSDVTGDAAADLVVTSVMRNARTLVSPLVKTGPGTMQLSATNTYTGSTSVEAGELILDTASLANASAVSIGASATLNLAHGAADTIGTLTLGGVQVAAGTYVAEGSATPGIPTPRLKGTGSLVVTTGPSLSYDEWSAIIPNPDDRDRTDDPDRDGFSNLDEFLFGASPIAATGSLTQASRSGSDLMVRWLQLTGAGSYVLQESLTLLDNPWPASGITPANDPDQSGLPTGYTRRQAIIPISGSRKFVRIEGAE